MAAKPQTLIEHLKERSRTRPDALYSRYLFDGREPATVTYRKTEERTRRFAACYYAAGVKRGDVVLVVLEHHQDLMPAFLAATWLGAIPAFLPAPNPRTRTERFYATLGSMIEQAHPAAVMTHPPVREMLQPIVEGLAGAPALLTPEDVPESMHGDPQPHGPEDVALIQFSSGSTGMQKGAMLSHRAILAEIHGVGSFFEMTEKDSYLTWVPLYHDWGLVCVALHSLVLGTSYTLISPFDWVVRPAIAFEAVTEFRPTIYYHPNFGFNFMTRRIKDKEMKGIDLSSIRICSNGAEPCLYESHKMFAERFSKWGFDPDSLGIVYGMAEVTNTVIAAGHKEPIRVDAIDRFILQKELRAQPVPADHPDAQRMLGVGRGLDGTEFKIVDDDRNEIPERQVGEVAIRSRARMHGYHENPEATAESLAEDGWYYSGDMGYRVGDLLHITGRKSDMIIVGGVNIYPQDIEGIVAEHPHAVAGRIAAIGIDDAEIGTQKIVLIVESKSTDQKVLDDIAKFARTQVQERLKIVVNRIVHAPYTWLIKTSSGKIARQPNYRRLHELEPDGDAAGPA